MFYVDMAIIFLLIIMLNKGIFFKGINFLWSTVNKNPFFIILVSYPLYNLNEIF